ALLFGLAVSGVGSHSSLVEGDPMGPFWLTGGGFGLDGTWIAFFVILAAIPVIFRLTRDLNYRYNAPVLEPGGIPVDLEAAARAQHEAAMGPVSPPLVRTIEPARGSAANGPVSGPVNGPVSGPVSRPVSEPANGPASVPGAAPGSSASGETPVDPPTTS
ncbi:MAG TPA: hypothetical protein VKU93_11060, partial [Terracidiphilus sp.]|nr:hypothetical protein [Terracidiphilus sp.]